MVDDSGRAGWLQVVAVSAAIVAVVIGASFATGLLPTELQRLVFHSPLLIGVLLGGTAIILWRVARHGPGA